jgi:CMP-N-acetylneuraminic acid synthetase
MRSIERVIALIPLRGGSKSIKNKNLALLGNKPLCAWPIESALTTPEISRVIVSTDNPEIAEVALSLGSEVQMRPAELATDTALVADTIRYTKMLLRAERETAKYMVLLEATSPFRSIALIQKCIQRLQEEGLDSIATFHEATLNPHRAWKIEANTPEPFIQGSIPWMPRQKLPKAYQLNGTVYAFNLETFPQITPSILFGKIGAEIIASDTIIDIDSLQDLELANALLNARNST